MSCNASPILESLEALAAETHEATVLGTHVVRAIQDAMPQASWVGIYWLEGNELVLGPYVGPETTHTHIPVGKGVCGVAVADEEDQLIDDVREIPHYIACSPATRSELVVLIHHEGTIVGQIDLDANEVGAFDPDDACVMRAVADGLGGLLKFKEPEARPIDDEIAPLKE